MDRRKFLERVALALGAVAFAEKFTTTSETEPQYEFVPPRNFLLPKAGHDIWYDFDTDTQYYRLVPEYSAMPSLETLSWRPQH